MVAVKRLANGRWTRQYPHTVGRIANVVRRTFIAHNFQPLTTTVFLARCYPRLTRYAVWQYRCVRKALRRVAVSLGRISGRKGRPILWAPKGHTENLSEMRGEKPA